MTNFEFGDIVLVPFPFTDQTHHKQRPAVVISPEAYHTARPDVIIMAVTSQIRSTQGFGEITIAEWQAAGLLKPSVIKPVLTTIEGSLIIKRLGQLQTDDKQSLNIGLQNLFGQSP